MTQHVFPKIKRLYAGVIALFATEKFFSGMNQHVSLEIISPCARVIALCASKRLLTTMNHHMAFQIAWPIVCVVALKATIRLLSIIQGLLGMFCKNVCLHFHVFSANDRFCTFRQGWKITNANKVILGK